MNLQFLADGILMGTMIGLGAIGVTLTYAILRFANFAHGEFIAWGTYLALIISGLAGTLTGTIAPIGALSFGWMLILAAIIAALLTGSIALALDWLKKNDPKTLKPHPEGRKKVLLSPRTSLTALRKTPAPWREGYCM